MHLDTRPVRCFCCPHIEIFMTASFEIEGIITVVKVGKFGEKAKVVFGVEFGIWCPNRSACGSLRSKKRPHLSLRVVTESPSRS